MHEGRIVALDSPAALLAGSGRELVELRIDGDVAAAVAVLRATASPATTRSSSAPPSTSRCTTGAGRDAVATITDLGLTASAVTSRAPTLDDVYLQLTGESLAA